MQQFSENQNISLDSIWEILNRTAQSQEKFDQERKKSNEELVQACINKGIAVLKQVGDTIVINDAHLKVY